MRNSLYLLVVVSFLAGDALQAQTLTNGFPARKRHLRAFDFWQKRVYPADSFPDGALQRALQEAAVANGRVAQALGTTGERWVNVGPTPMFSTTLLPSGGGYSGRISCLAVNPANTNHWLAGAAIGGVWETKNAGVTWTPISDYEANISMGAIAFANTDTNTIYVGTGEAHSSNSYPGTGLLKSVNGGRTWTLLASNVFAKASFNELRVSPADANVLYAVSAPPNNSDGLVRAPASPDTGFHRSTDGGVTWTRTLTGEATDMEVHPADFTRVLAALGQRAANVDNGVYRSTDAGVTWAKITGPWSAMNGVGRIELAIAPSNPDVAYVSIHNFTLNKANLLGVWKTANAWTATPTWTQLSQPPAAQLGDQWGYDHDIIVHPADENLVFLGGTAVFRLDGSTWTPVAGHYDPQSNSYFIHPDQQVFAWAGTRLVVGNDGGVFSSANNGTNWNNHNTTLATIQFYHGSVHPTRPDHLIGGAQDNSCFVWVGTNGTWSELTTGDGTDSAYSRQNPDTKWIYSDQQLGLYRTTDGGVTSIQPTTGLPSSGAPFVPRLAINPFNEDIALAGHTNLYRCVNMFSSATPTWALNGPNTTAGSVSAIAFAFSNITGDTYAYATDQGEMRLTTDGGATWRDVFNASDLPSRYINNLAFHPTNAAVLYVVFSGFNESTPTRIGHVFRTANALAVTPSWTRVGPAVNIPHNAITIDPSNTETLYLGNDIGVWRSLDGAATWTQLGTSFGLPNVPVFDIEVNAIGRAVAFTHGRSAFTLVHDAHRTLASRVSGNNLVVSVPALAVFPVLQSTTSLTGTPNWVNLPAPVLSGTNYSVTNVIGGTAAFFRLQTK